MTLKMSQKTTKAITRSDFHKSVYLRLKVTIHISKRKRKNYTLNERIIHLKERISKHKCSFMHHILQKTEAEQEYFHLISIPEYSPNNFTSTSCGMQYTLSLTGNLNTFFIRPHS